MKTISRNAIIGYPAGIITGVSYGLNPLFALPLIKEGASIESILFFRYIISVLLLGAFLFLNKQSFRINLKQARILFVLGLLYTSSSIFLFEAFKYIASGLAISFVFLDRVFVAIILFFFNLFLSWRGGLSFFLTFAGVVIMTQSDSTQTISPFGVFLSLVSALVYAMFIVIINRSKTIRNISNSLLTFYTLSVGSVVFFIKLMISDAEITAGLEKDMAWLNLVGLAILPTIVSTATLAVATRNIGATKASVLGVFEPITAILIGAFVFGEPITTNIIVGILISIAAVIFMIAKTKR